MRRIAVLPILLLSGACAHSSVNVIQQASPNPFAGKTRFFVAAPDFSHATINGKPVASWVSEGGAEEAKDWEGNHTDAAKKFIDRIAEKKGKLEIDTQGQPAADAIIVQPIVESIETGVFGLSSTNVVLRLTVAMGTNPPADIVTTQASQHADLYHPSFNQRLGNTSEDLAEKTVDYIASRTK